MQSGAQAEDLNVAVKRILSEPAKVIKNGFRVVEDADPIVVGHLLLVTEEPVESLADTNLELLQEFVTERLGAVCNMPYFLIERGRAPFCTSFGSVHAHAHLIPLVAVPEISSAIARKTRDVVATGDLCPVLQAAPVGAEYLLWGSLGDSFTLSLPVFGAAKRLVRAIVRDSLTNDQAGAL